MNYICRSPDRSQVGSVNIMSWSTNTPSDSSTYASAKVQNDLTSAWHADKAFRTKKKEQLKFLFSNTVCKVGAFTMRGRCRCYVTLLCKVGAGAM